MHGGSSSPLCPQSPSSSPFPGEGLKGNRKSGSPSLGTQGLFVSISGSMVGGSSDIISGLGGPHCLLPCLLHRKQVLLSASSVPRGVRGSGTVDSARFGDPVDTQPHSPAWKQQHCWHQGGNLAAVSLVLSPELLTTGVITSPQGLSEAVGLRVGWGPLTISGLQPKDKADCSCSAGTQPCYSQQASGQEEVTLSSRAHPQVESQSTGLDACSWSLSVSFHMCMQGLQSWPGWAVGHSQQ